MYKRVLVTLAESVTSESVIPEVERMTVGSDVPVTILLTVAAFPAPTLLTVPDAREVPAMVGGRSASTALEPRLVESMDQALNRLEDDLNTYLETKARPMRDKGFTVETVVRFGNPAAQIIDYAETNDIDMIVMANHGRTGPSRILFGSVAARVIASGVKPVLMVRPRAVVDQT